MDVVLVNSFVDFITAFLSLTSASIFYVTYKLIDVFDLQPPCFSLGASNHCTGHKRLNLTGHHFRHNTHRLHKKPLGTKTFGVSSLHCSSQSNGASITDDVDHLKAVITQFKAYPQELVDQHAVPHNEKCEEYPTLISDVGKLSGYRQSSNGDQIVRLKHVDGSVHISREVGSSIENVSHLPYRFNESGENEQKMDMLARIPCDTDEDNLLEDGCFDDIEKLKEELFSQRHIIDSTYEELDKQRTASASAAGEAMAMISKLQKEKAEIQMEAMQYLRMAKEKEAFDEKAIIDLRDALVKQEAEVLALEKEMETCRRWIVMKNTDSEVKTHEKHLFQDNILCQNLSFYEQDKMNFLQHQYESSEHSETYISEEMLHPGRNVVIPRVFGNVSSVLINDLRTSSMVQRDNSRVLLKEQVCSLESKLNTLEADRELLKDTIKLSLPALAKEMEISPTNT